ncbi:MAG TPA: Fic family protein [Candidatus Pelethocola excrementipullorum]|nr:Fic family protein [Candidatus Pelethocola excrementipullorum]
MKELQELLQKADLYKEQLSQAPTTSGIKEDDNLRITFTYRTNALAGSPLTLPETKQLLEDGPAEGMSNLNDWYEVEGTSKGYDYMLELAEKPEMDITEDEIIRLHKLFYQKIDSGRAGRYRITPSSHEGFTAPDFEEVPRFTSHLIDQINSSKTTLHPIELAAMVHKRLLDIQPFDGGNLQIATLVMNLILIHNGYGVVSIPPALHKDYLTNLSASRRLYDMEPFSILIAKCVIEAEHR